MDIDRDLDAGLLQQFSCLGTTDRDVLISQFQKVTGNQLNPTGCAFFLDMSNWNIQAAVCAYFDFERDNLPKMTFIRDVTIGEGEAVSPDTNFVKTWKLLNPCNERWPVGCYLQFTSGDQMSESSRVFVEPLIGHRTTNVSVEMKSPQNPGIYQGQWRMCTPTGHFFGDVIWVIITVAEGGLLGLTQQMDAFHQLGSPPRSLLIPDNPFAVFNYKCGAEQKPSLTSPSHNDDDSEVPQMSIDSTNSQESIDESPSSPMRNQNLEESEQFYVMPNSTDNSQRNESSIEDMTS